MPFTTHSNDRDQTSGIQKLLGKEIGKNVGDLFKKNTSILNLTPSEYLASINKRNVPGDTDDPALDTTDLFS
ncbi:hypothetical protein SARC_10440 [Sphaeroforma arctica JP610]|uniref:Uncharacterized protein n=1 Tax=Sphaeroforma arctica JP610 TaxID=667725 RepID=A0A0L0FKW2_9EUKA|nr:hypothetical protein SARC_10440 [Sphaeroforma arctica JP610]KNC77091.1 hypothetical protein SARC_10440 [Sphaeroforma arctica JP610]|eukprot:XP_014150993.1 hypothetical protein SARC_10440 [Sphaeroforma arctica JP610]